MNPDEHNTIEHSPSHAPALEGDESQRAGETAPGPGSQRAQAAAPATGGASRPDDESANAPRPTIVVMHASVGSWHRSAANAVAQAFDLLRDELSTADLAPEGPDAPPPFPQDSGCCSCSGQKEGWSFGRLPRIFCIPCAPQVSFSLPAAV